MKPKIFGHRGACGSAPENTMAAFKKAYDQGVKGIEVDVQYTKDHELVIIHDFSVDRCSDGKGYVFDHTLDELKKLDFGRWFGEEFAGEKIMTLQELAQYIKDTGLELNLEVKTIATRYDQKIVSDIDAILQQYGIADCVIVSSFYHQLLVDYKVINPLMKTGMLYAAGFTQIAEYAKKIQVDYIHPDFQFIDVSLGNECRENNIQMNTWTVNEPLFYEHLKDQGINILITNYPDRFVSL